MRQCLHFRALEKKTRVAWWRLGQIVMYMGNFTTKRSRSENQTEFAAFSLELPLVVQSDNGGAGGEKMHLVDSDDRACAFIAGAAPNRWGENDWGWKASETPATSEDEELEIAAEAREIWHQRRKHPLYPSAALSVLAEVVFASCSSIGRGDLGGGGGGEKKKGEKKKRARLDKSETFIIIWIEGGFGCRLLFTR